MRFLRLAWNYPTYLKSFYARHVGLGREHYRVQFQTLMEDCFGRANFFTHALGKIGYDVWEPVCNAEPMQKAWARENGVRYTETSWVTDIITAQVTLFKPEIVFVAKQPVINSDFLDHLRGECKSIRLMFGWIDSPFEDEEVIKRWDLIISNIPSVVDAYRTRGRRSEYMCYAFEPRVLERIDLKANPVIPFSFVGSIVKGPGFHNQREQLMKRLVQETEIQVFADVSRPSRSEARVLSLQRSLFKFVQRMKSISGASSVLAALPVLRNYVSMERAPDLSHYVDPAIMARCQPPVFGLSMYQTLRNSKVVFNNHIDLSNQFASNMRLFEGTGVGSCLLTDWKQNLHHLYEPDQEVVTYRSIEEAIEKVGYLLTHEEDRQRIAAAGQRRTLHNYTYDHRAQELDQLIKNHLRG